MTETPRVILSGFADEAANEQRARLVKQAERPEPTRRVLRFGRLTLAWGS